MTLTNHLLIGATLAKFLPLPMALPLAFASHFALDALPHFGFNTIAERQKRLPLFHAVNAVDAAVGIALAAWLMLSGHAGWALSGLVAYSPDLLWIYRFIVPEKFGKIAPTKGGRFAQFHRNIQKYESLWGGAFELVFGIALFSTLR